MMLVAVVETPAALRRLINFRFIIIIIISGSYDP